MCARITFVVLACLFLLPAHAEPTGFRTYQLAQHGSLQFAVPRTWNDQMRQEQKNLPPTILFTPDHGYDFVVQVTAYWPDKTDSAMRSMEEIKALVSKAAERKKSEALETVVPINELQGASGSGYYYSITDRAPGAGGFKHLTEGMLRVEKLDVAFTILSNDGAESAVADALNMIKGARQVDSEKH